MAPFSNSTEYEIWAARWCDRCEWFYDCQLLLQAFLGETPAQWKEVGPSDYECAAFSKDTSG